MLETNTNLKTLLQNISKDYWLMLFLVFLMKAGQFMLLPFLALFLSMKMHASPSMIGITIGVGAITYGLSAPLWGYVIDRFSPQTTISLSVFLSGILFLIFNAHHSILYLTCINIAVSLTRSLFDTATRSYRIHHMSLEQRRLAISLRCTCVNVAAALGPAITVNFIFTSATTLFVSIGGVYLILSVWTCFLLKNKDVFFNRQEPIHFKKVIKLLATDKKLLAITLAYFLFWISYAQTNTAWPLYLHQTLSTTGIHIFTIAIIVNAVGCAFIQIPLSRITKLISYETQAILGSLFFSGGFFIYMITLHMNWIIVGALLFVLGESFFIPLADLLTYLIAPKPLVASYYGTMLLGGVGLGIGPIIGGYLYEYGNFYSVGALCIGAFIIMGVLLWKVAHWNKNQSNAAV